MTREIQALIDKCNAGSIANRGSYSAITSTKAVVRKSGKSLADDPALNIESALLYSGNKSVSLKVLNIQPDITVTYESDDTKVATVSAKGVVTRKAAGQCNITASYTDPETESEISFTCKVTCSDAVAMVDTKEFTSLDEAVQMAQTRRMPLVPLANSQTYTFKTPTEKLLVKNVYSGAKFYPKPIPVSADKVYEVYSRKIESNVNEYYCVETGTPDFEFTNSKTGAVSYMALGTASFTTSGTYKLLKDIPEMKKTIYCDGGAFGCDIVIDLDGHTIVATKNTAKGHPSQTLAAIDAIRATVTIKNGTVKTTPDSGYYGVHNRYGYVTTLENVNVTGDAHAVYVQQGTTNVNGGEYVAHPVSDGKDPYRFTLNCLDANYKSGTAKINVSAGSFYKFNPADNLAEGEGTNFVVDGKTSVQDGDWYKVS